MQPWSKAIVFEGLHGDQNGKSACKTWRRSTRARVKKAQALDLGLLASHRSISAFATEDDLDSAQQDHDVVEQRPVLDIPRIQVDTGIVSHIITAADLP